MATECSSGSLILQAKRLGKNFGLHRALDDISIDLREGEVHVLAGENGAGKSTLIKILTGVYGDYDGQLELRGIETRFANPAEARIRGISVIHQELSLVDSMSVSDNLFLGRELSRLGGCWLDKASQKRRSLEICGELGLDFEAADLARPVGDYGLAVKNRIEIAKALCDDARILILDEPTSALDRSEVERLFEIIEKLKSRGCGIIYISHKMEEIYRLADRITVLRDGRWVGTAMAADCPRDRLIEWMIGRAVSEQIPIRRHPIPASAAARLEIDSFTVASAEPDCPVAVRDFSLSIRAGEIVGLAGLQGSGNGELFRGLFGAGGNCVGMVRLDGKPFIPGAPATSIARGLCYLPADRKSSGIVPSASVTRNMTLASLRRFSTCGFLREGKERSCSARRAASLGIRAVSLEQPISTLSGGNQQKVLLARWLEARPKVLLLEEPTRGVDVGAKREIYLLMRRCAEEGMAILLISTEMPELLGLSDRVVVLHRGETTACLEGIESTPEAVLKAAMGVAA